jgi:hypothetical protein
MVRFDTSPESFNTVKMLRKLESDVENLINLDNHIIAMEEEIMVNAKYVKLCGNAGGSSTSVVRAAASAEMDDEALGNALPSSASGSRGGSAGPGGASSSSMNSNNINFTNP